MASIGECSYQVQPTINIDPEIGKHCVGKLTYVPKPHSRVYYYPQGHIRQVSYSVSLPPSATCVLCRVIEVLYLADPDTDEVFLKLHLQPLKNYDSICSSQSGEEESKLETTNNIVSFSKVLTVSDFNNGGGFTVPVKCADNIFPPLAKETDKPVQNLRITDIHGKSWEFRHIYRGKPLRHLFTSGWTKFVNAKNLIDGDTITFIKKISTDQDTIEIFVGIRRKFLSNLTIKRIDEYAKSVLGIALNKTEPVIGSGFSRRERGRSLVKDVIESISMAGRGDDFEVVYYPRKGLPEFIVAAEKVESYWSQLYKWYVGMKVKICRETDDGDQLQWYTGTISNVKTISESLNYDQFLNSLWQRLEVIWDVKEPKNLKNMKSNASPWQVECIPTTPTTQKTNSRLVTNGAGDLSLRSLKFSLTLGNFGPSTFPIGMQGARQNLSLYSSLPTNNIVSDSTHQDQGCQETNNMEVGSSTSLCLTSSPDDQSIVPSIGVAYTDPMRYHLCSKNSATIQFLDLKPFGDQPSPTTDDIGCIVQI